MKNNTKKKSHTVIVKENIKKIMKEDIFGMGNENILIVIKYMFKYVVKQKVYLYGRNKK